MHNLSDPNQHQAKEIDSIKSVTNIQIHECSHRRTHQQSSNNLGVFHECSDLPTYLPTDNPPTTLGVSWVLRPTYPPPIFQQPWQPIEKTSTSTSIQTWVANKKKSSSIQPASQSVSQSVIHGDGVTSRGEENVCCACEKSLQVDGSWMLHIWSLHSRMWFHNYMVIQSLIQGWFQ
jgi:hypothetical protein